MSLALKHVHKIQHQQDKKLTKHGMTMGHVHFDNKVHGI